MTLIDLTTQAQAPQSGGLTLQSSAATSSLTGLHTLEFDTLNLDNLGTGSLNIGTANTLTAGKIKIAHPTDPVIQDANDNTVIEVLTTGFPSGSVKVYGDLIVQGSSSYQNVNTFAVEDPIIDLNFTGSTALSSTDSGLRVGRSGATNAALVFDHSETRWAIDNAAGSYINIVGVSTTDTLTNKTLTSPTLTTPKIADAGYIADANGNEQVVFQTTSSAVNHLEVTNAATSNNPVLGAVGDDSNIGITLTPKGTGEVVIAAGNLNYGGTAVTSTGAELNKLDGVTATATELNYLDLATLGTSAASKVLSTDANNLTKITGGVYLEEDTLTFDATQDWDVRASPVAKVTLTANVTFDAPTNPTTGQFISIVCIQDGTGSRTIAWNSVFEFAGDEAPTATTTASKGDMFNFRYNGSKWLEVGRNLNLTLS